MRRLPFAKPRRKPKARRAFNSTLPAATRPIKRGGWIARTAMVPKRNAKRKETEFARCFHSRRRVRFVKSLRCVVTGMRASRDVAIDNAHVVNDGTKGMGRRAGYRCIAPLASAVHRLLHDAPDRFAARFPGWTEDRWATEARRTEQRWLTFSHSRDLR